VLAAGAAGAIGVSGSAGDDLIVGTPGVDRIAARAGDDRILVWGDGRRDLVDCGHGLDLVNAERNDVLDGSCETVVRQISQDRLPARSGGQHSTQAEPHSESVGDTVVTVFQIGRFRDGGAAAVGYSTSHDAGVSWREGILPRPPGYERQTDPVVAYDAMRGVWLAATLGLSRSGGTALLVSRSTDGLVWEPPVVADAAPGAEDGLDKEWIVCDNGAASPFHGRCYLAATELSLSTVQVQTSVDGGVTWSRPVFPQRTSPTGALGALPVVLQNGDLIVFFTEDHEGPTALRSTDGGARLSPVNGVFGGGLAPVKGVRTAHLISADVDPTGRAIAVWAECGLRSRCDGNDIVLTESTDGVAWSRRRRLPTRATGNAFMPAVATDPRTGRIGVLYFAATGCQRRCRLDAWLLESPDGRRWTRPVRLSARSLELPWIARSQQGAMLGDYVSISYVGGRPMAVFTAAEAPIEGRLRQATFAAVTVAPALRAVR
jgi:hypothetical protein